MIKLASLILEGFDPKKTLKSKSDATDYLKWFEAEKDLSHWNASRSAHWKPLGANMSFDPFHKASLARVILGTHEYQHSYDQMKRQYPGLSQDKYNQIRKKYGIDK